ncbi:VOC family protein [Gordonia terrae]|nr:VOC family protein [Gordonia terrae]UPW07803.1 VOC family protein [Gordonia terrae]
MITAVHTDLLRRPGGRRAFFRDVLAFPHVDTGGGWLIFQTGPSELGAHPDKWEHEGTAGRTDQKFDVSFMCDDLESTMHELSARGAEFVGAPTDEGWGVTVGIKVPGAGQITLYEPKYPPPALR